MIGHWLGLLSNDKIKSTYVSTLLPTCPLAAFHIFGALVELLHLKSSFHPLIHSQKKIERKL